MELLLDNLKNAIIKGKHGRIKEIALPDRKLLISIAVTVSLSILVGRSAFLNSMEAVAIALITVLVSGSKANIYALPFILAGMFGAIGTGYGYPGVIAALVICAFALLLPPVRKFPLQLKALMAGTLLVCIKVLYYLWAGLLFLYDIKTIALDLLILFGAIFIFYSFFSLIENKGENDDSHVEPIPVLSVVVLFSVGGLGIPDMGQVSILHVVAFLIALITGYGMGPGAGGLAGIVWIPGDSYEL